MKFSIKRQFVLYIFMVLPAILPAQHSLLQDSVFINARIQDYQDWLDTFGLSEVLVIRNHSIHPEKLLLTLASAHNKYNCREVQETWKSWYSSFNQSHKGNKLLHEKLIEVLSVLTEISTDSLEIEVKCEEGDGFLIKIFSDQQKRIRLKDHFIETQGEGIFAIPMLDVFKINAGVRLDSLSRDLTLRRVRLAIGDYLLNKWYKGKGTPVLYNVRIDTSSSFAHEFSWEFTHLSHEVLKDEGYYEYHRVGVKIQDLNGFIQVNWSFTGKYGSGILFPPRKNDYKLMEIEHSEEVHEYEEKLFKSVNEYLKRLL